MRGLGRGRRMGAAQRELARTSLNGAALRVGRLEVDLGVDWRRDDPVRLDVGPVLNLADAVGSKVGALYSRGEVHDYLDVDAIRASGRLSYEELVAAMGDRGLGFEIGMLSGGRTSLAGSAWTTWCATACPVNS